MREDEDDERQSKTNEKLLKQFFVFVCMFLCLVN